MAKPQYYPDWALDDVNLPSTGKINKVRPREIIRRTGWDKGQIPTAEEVNWTFNSWGQWIKYFDSEFIPSLPNTYLPKNGASISFQGDLSGTISWTGANQGTGNIQVLDNSHNHIGDNITDATFAPTPNKIVKRDGNGGADFRRDITVQTDGSNADIWFRRSNDNGTGVGLNYAQSAELFQIYYIGNNGTDIKSYLQMFPGVVQFTNPRSMTGQEGQPGSLIRFDYFRQQVDDTNRTINNVNGDLQNYKNNAYNTFVSDIRLGATYTKVINKNTAITADGGGVLIGYYFEGDNPQGDTLYIKPIQKAVGGNWYTIGQL